MACWKAEATPWMSVARPPIVTLQVLPRHLFSTLIPRGTHPAVRRPLPSSPVTPYQFDVALSFAGEDRAFVESVAAHLKAAHVKVFYDRDSEVYLWGKDLTETLDDIYRNHSRYVVFFISSHYAEKMWTRHERRSALARSLSEKYEYILPARFDATPLPGLQPTVAYISLTQETPQSFAEKLIAKIKGTVSEEAPFPRPIGEVRTLHGHTAKVTNLRFSNDGTRALSSSLDTTVRLWDLETGSEIRRFTGHTGEVHAVDWSSDERYAISGSGSDISLRGSGLLAKVKIEIMGDKTRPEDYSVRLWDIARGVQLHRFSTIKAEIVALHPARTHFLCANHSSCEIWNIATGQRVGEIELPERDGFREARYSADGGHLFFISYYQVYTYTSEGTLVRTLEPKVDGRVHRHYAFAPDGRHLLRYHSPLSTSYVYPEFSTHDLITGEVDRSSSKLTVSFYEMAFAGNLKRVFGRSLEFLAFDLDSNELCFSQNDDGYPYNALALSNDGRRGLSGSDEGPIRLWQLP